MWRRNYATNQHCMSFYLRMPDKYVISYILSWQSCLQNFLSRVYKDCPVNFAAFVKNFIHLVYGKISPPLNTFYPLCCHPFQIFYLMPCKLHRKFWETQIHRKYCYLKPIQKTTIRRMGPRDYYGIMKAVQSLGNSKDTDIDKIWNEYAKIAGKKSKVNEELA